MTIDPTIITAISGLILGAGGAWIAWNTQRISARKDEVETIRVALSALQTENKRLRVRMDELEHENAALRRWAAKLAKQIIALGHEPAMYEEIHSIKNPESGKSKDDEE